MGAAHFLLTKVTTELVAKLTLLLFGGKAELGWVESATYRKAGKILITAPLQEKREEDAQKKKKLIQQEGQKIAPCLNPSHRRAAVV